MRFLQRLLSVLVAVLAVAVIGSMVLKEYRDNAGVRQSVSEAANKAGDAIADAASRMDSQIGDAIDKAAGLTAGGNDGAAAGSGNGPAIPLVSNITSAPSGNVAQAKVAAPVPAADLQSVWGETGMKGLTVYEYGKTLLSDEGKSCYVDIADAVENIEPNVTVRTSLSPAAAEKVYEYYVYDHAEVFYLDGVSLKYTQSGGEYTYQFAFSYKYGGNKSTIESMRSQLREKALDALSAAAGLSTDLEKEKALHDRLINLCSYDLAAAQDPDASPDSFSAYGALVDKKAVCQGYAQAMKLLLSSAGIKSVYITGQADGGSHAWNIAEIGGHWLYLDATFDDPVFTDASGNYVSYNTVSYTYFNFISKSDHVPGKFDSANPFSSTSENYAAMPKIG